MSRSAAAPGRKRARDLAETVDEPPQRTPFAHFASVKRADVAAQRPQWTEQRVSSELTRQWKALSDAERRPFVELAEFDRVQSLQQQCAADRPTADAHASARAVQREPLPSKRGKPGNEPRQPDTPYICFWKYERPAVVAEYPNMAAPNVSREVGLRWKALSADERQEWIDLAARDRQRYEVEMAAYRKLQTIEDPSSAKIPTPPAVDDVLTLGPSLPKSAFQCFLVHNRESLALLSMTANEFQSEMSALWNRMGHDEKQVWLDMAADDQVRYEMEMAALQRPVSTSHSNKRLDQLKQAAARMENAPRLPQSASAFFTAAKRRELQAEQPSMKASDMNREISKAWKTMNAYDRLPFIGDEQRDVERFVREMDALLALNGGENEELLVASTESHVINDTRTTPRVPHPQRATTPASATTRLGRKAKSVLPKRPMTAYNMMYLAKRDELMRAYQLSQNECSALCGRMWRQMAESERQQYYRMAAQDKERYLNEVEQHRRTKSGSATASGKKAAVLTTKAKPRKTESARPSTWNAVSSNQANRSLLDTKGTSEDLQRLEQSARAVFGDAFVGHEEEPYDFDSAQATPGFLYYVDSKRSDREQWTTEMWVDDWESLAPPHRALWEELASTGVPGHNQSHHLQRQQHVSARQTGARYHQDRSNHDQHGSQPRHPDHMRALVGDLDLLYGLVRGASASAFGET